MVNRNVHSSSRGWLCFKVFILFSVFNLLSFLCFVSPFWGKEVLPLDQNEYVAGELLVKFKNEALEFQKQQIRESLQARRIKVVKQLRVELWRLSPEMLPTAIQQLNADPLIEYAEPNYIYRPMAVPNDNLYNQLWFLSNTGQTVASRAGTVGADIDAEAAWEITTGSRDVVIAVLDSGVALDHPDLKNNIWTNSDEIPDDGIDNDNNDYIDDINGWDFANGETGDNDPTDMSNGTNSNGHGTHVAGTIAAEGNNQQGITGVMWQAQIMPLLLYDLYFEDLPYAGAIHSLKVALAIIYAVENGAQIINMSFGGSAQSQSIYDAIKIADQAGVLAVVAAGNEANDNDVLPQYPADYDLPNILTVAATDENDQLASYSNYGINNVDVAAPGGDHPNGIPDNLLSLTPPQRQVLFSDDFDSGGGQWSTDGVHEVWKIKNDPVLGSFLDSSTNEIQPNELSYVKPTTGFATSGYKGIVFQYDIFYDLEENGDFLSFEASYDGQNYQTFGKFTGEYIGEITRWLNGTFDEIYFRFVLRSDAKSTFDWGVQLYNFEMTGIPWAYDGDEYGFKVGTSMAAPVVAGVAGLLLAYDPNLTHYEIKSAIENSVDKLDALNGKVAASGRVNAYKALRYIGASADESDTNPNAETGGGGGGGGGCFISVVNQ